MRVHCLVPAYAFAHSLEFSPLSLFMTLAQAVKLAQNHEHTYLSNIVLAGPCVLLSFALRKWAQVGMWQGHHLIFKVILSCVRVQISPYCYWAYPNSSCVSIY